MEVEAYARQNSIENPFFLRTSLWFRWGIGALQLRYMNHVKFDSMENYKNVVAGHYDCAQYQCVY